MSPLRRPAARLSRVISARVCPSCQRRLSVISTAACQPAGLPRPADTVAHGNEDIGLKWYCPAQAEVHDLDHGCVVVRPIGGEHDDVVNKVKATVPGYRRQTWGNVTGKSAGAAQAITPVRSEMESTCRTADSRHGVGAPLSRQYV